jgi:hypothetical protein
VIEHRETVSEIYIVPGKNIAVDELTVLFKGKIIFKNYNTKNQLSGA